MQLIKRPPRKEPQLPAVSVKQFYERRNKVLVVRKLGGLGDILMHMMMFEDFKRLMPEMHLVYACPLGFHDVVKGHPFIDEIVDSATVNVKDYPISFDTTNCCIRYELGNHPDKVLKHRTDIWAEHCGVLCTKHNMHLTVPENVAEWGKNKVKSLKSNIPAGPSVMFVPLSYDPHRSLQEVQIRQVVEGLRARGCFLYSAHTRPVNSLDVLKVPVVTDADVSQWLGLVNAADYVVTVDTSAYHAAGGLKKPMVGIFTYIDGYVRGQYYDHILVQKHRYNGDWDCGPCFNWQACTKIKKNSPDNVMRPCLTEITGHMIMEGVDRMFERWPWKRPLPGR